MCHIELETLKPERAPLPMTETGYRSILITAPELEDEGGAEALVLGMLNEAAKSGNGRKPNCNAASSRFFDISKTISIKIIKNIHFFMWHTDNINMTVPNEIENQVRALRKTIIAALNIRAVFADLRTFSQP
jgi:hypothetical protein